jgi:hypothetical protein
MSPNQIVIGWAKKNCQQLEERSCRCLVWHKTALLLQLSPYSWREMVPPCKLAVLQQSASDPFVMDKQLTSPYMKVKGRKNFFSLRQTWGNNPPPPPPAGRCTAVQFSGHLLGGGGVMYLDEINKNI